jgi:hypothetical protein
VKSFGEAKIPERNPLREKTVTDFQGVEVCTSMDLFCITHSKLSILEYYNYVMHI